MKITELLKEKTLSLSFEVFPPKTDTAFDSVKHATEEIAALRPAFMSVTYGAGGGTSRYTLDIAKNIKDTYGVPTLAHLTCVSSTKETVYQRIVDMKEAGIQNVMALRGDLTPELMDSDRSGWTYHHAVDLIRELKECGADFCIGGACYPEVHPESSNQAEDIRYLKEKVDAGCSFLTTQMFFDNQKYYDFVDRCREAGITVPIIPGIKPITSVNQLTILPKVFHVDLPSELAKELMNCKDDAMAKVLGVEWCTAQIRDLLDHGIPSVHFYSLNATQSVKQVASKIF